MTERIWLNLDAEAQDRLRQAQTRCDRCPAIGPTRVNGFGYRLCAKCWPQPVKSGSFAP